MIDKYFVFDQIEGEMSLFVTEEQAKKEAERILSKYRDHASGDGWPGNMDGLVGWGKIKETTQESMCKDIEDYTAEEWEEMGFSSDFDKIYDYELKKIKE